MKPNRNSHGPPRAVMLTLVGLLAPAQLGACGVRDGPIIHAIITTTVAPASMATTTTIAPTTSTTTTTTTTTTTATPTTTTTTTTTTTAPPTTTTMSATTSTTTSTTTAVTSTTVAPSTTAAATSTVAPIPPPAPAYQLAAPALPVPTFPPDPNAREAAPLIGTIRMPTVGIDSPLYDGVTQPTLELGPGHWPGTAWPGQIGNVVIGGHRTIHNAVFRRIGELRAGDPITIQDANGLHAYSVRHLIVVEPTDVWIIDPTDTATITLFACHPLGSERQRIIVVGDLVE